MCLAPPAAISDWELREIARPGLIDDRQNIVDSQQNVRPCSRAQNEDSQRKCSESMRRWQGRVASDGIPLLPLLPPGEKGQEGRSYRPCDSSDVCPAVSECLGRTGFSQARQTDSDFNSWSRTTCTCCASTPSNQSRNSSVDAPALRFSKSADTGTRVPRNTQAPLTLSGWRSTASQSSQLGMGSPTIGPGSVGIRGPGGLRKSLQSSISAHTPPGRWGPWDLRNVSR